jgi:hypothetical protein
MIAFPLGVRDPGAPESAGKHKGTGVDPAKRTLLRLSLARQARDDKTAQAALDLLLPGRKRMREFFCNTFHASLCFRSAGNDSFWCILLPPED